MGCSHNCDSCSSHCGGEKSLKVAANPAASVKKVIGVVSGKGGVGKSLLTSMMAVGMTRKGYSCGVLDADITGPSIPKTFGVHGQLEGCEEGILPARSEGGVQMISINLVLRMRTIRLFTAVRSSRRPSSSSGLTLYGTTWTSCLSICLPERATYR